MRLNINKDAPEKEIDYESYIEKRHDLIFLTKKVKRGKNKTNANKIKNKSVVFNNNYENIIETNTWKNMMIDCNYTKGIT